MHQVKTAVIIGLILGHYNASYVYDYGNGAWSKDLTPNDTIYTSLFRVMFGNSGTVWTSSGFEGFIYVFYDLPSNSAKTTNGGRTTSRHRTMLDSL